MRSRFDLKGKKIWVAGHSGLVGSSTLRRLAQESCEILTASHADLDLTNQQDTDNWIAGYKPDAIILAAAKVGGIGANASAPAAFLHTNLAIAQNVIHAAHRHDVSKLLFLGSSCIYPKMAQQPIKEEALLTGPLEPTNEGYAIAKIAGLKLCQFYRRQYSCDFISVMPTNLYGPGDWFNTENSHVIPALLTKMHQAKISGDSQVEIWSSGRARREFLYADDLTDALIHVLKHYSEEMPLNIGSGQEYTIAALAELMKEVTGYSGDLVFDASKPDGAPRKLLDCKRLHALGWQAKIDLRQGLENTYDWFCQQQALKQAA